MPCGMPSWRWLLQHLERVEAEALLCAALEFLSHPLPTPLLTPRMQRGCFPGAVSGQKWACCLVRRASPNGLGTAKMQLTELDRESVLSLDGPHLLMGLPGKATQCWSPCSVMG